MEMMNELGPRRGGNPQPRWTARFCPPRCQAPPPPPSFRSRSGVYGQSPLDPCRCACSADGATARRLGCAGRCPKAWPVSVGSGRPVSSTASASTMDAGQPGRTTVPERLRLCGDVRAAFRHPGAEPAGAAVRLRAGRGSPKPTYRWSEHPGPRDSPGPARARSHGLGNLREQGDGRGPSRGLDRVEGVGRGGPWSRAEPGRLRGVGASSSMITARSSVEGHRAASRPPCARGEWWVSCGPLC